MKLLHGWLSEFVDLPESPEVVAETLTRLGLAVESILEVDRPVEGVIVARVLRCERHPDAGHVQRVWVDTGDGAERHVWCGAFNMTPGDLVPLATVGTTMPDGRLIGQRPILGHVSQGMLCSSTELALGADAQGIMILPPSLTVGDALWAALGVAPETLYDVDVTRNRPEALGHLGVARELAAAFARPLRQPQGSPVSIGPDRVIPVTVEDQVACPRFVVRAISGVVVGPGPARLARRLEHCGMRSINNVVDASNLVNLERNQPNHAYDASAVGGGFVVRRAGNGERLITLDGEDRELDSDDLVIADANGRPVGLAGVMGGRDSEVMASTTELLIEAADFDPFVVRATAQRHVLRTEASIRFERGCDPWGAEAAIERFASILGETCPALVLHGVGGEVTGDGCRPRSTAIGVRLAAIERSLGIDVDGARVRELLEPIGFTVEATDGSAVVGVPSFRPDCKEEIDVVEEIARLHGYGNIPMRRLGATTPGSLSATQRRRRIVREVLVGLGCAEVMPNPILRDGALDAVGLSEAAAPRLANPLVADERVLRTSLRAGLLDVVSRNLDQRVDGVAVFEIGHVYPRGADLLPDEREHVGVMVAGSDARVAIETWVEIASALGVGARLDQETRPPGLHAGRAATLRRGRDEIGVVGEIDPGVLDSHGIAERVAYLEVDLGALLADEPAPAMARSVSRYPSSRFDLAFLCPENLEAQAVVKALTTAGKGSLVAVRLFDVYRGEGLPTGMRSLAFRLVAQAPDRTLTDDDTAALRQRCIEAAERLGGILRA